MGQEPASAEPMFEDLGDGLVLRRATADDIEALATFNADVFREADGAPSEAFANWTRDLLDGAHPGCSPHDFTLVEDTRSGRIASSICLVSQRWSYAAIPFGVGLVDIVATHPDYRRRGLVRTQLDVIHRWSAERGELVQAIQGLPWFYRQFGYELGGLSLGGGRRGCLPVSLQAEPETAEVYRVRPALEADLPCIAQLYARREQRHLVACLRDEASWRHELSGGRFPNSSAPTQLCIIETDHREPIGYLAHPTQLIDGQVGAHEYELLPDVAWLRVTPSVLRYLAARGKEYAARTQQRCSTLTFWLGTQHPLYDLTVNRLPVVQEPYAWYLRVPDLPGFISRIAPVLEERLAGSSLAGHTGELTISLYRDGLRLVFERGRLAAVESWKPTPIRDCAAAFPGLTLLQLLFGYRTLEELTYAFADCRIVSDEAHALLSILFPRHVSNVWPLR